MVVMDVFTRRIIRFGVAPANLDGPLVCRNVLSGDREAETAAAPLIRSRSVVSLSSWLANLRILEARRLLLLRSLGGAMN